MTEEQQQEILQALRNLVSAIETLVVPMSKYVDPRDMVKDFSTENQPKVLALIEQIEKIITIER